MKISPDYMNYDDSFKKFIISDEGKRGYLISMKGESNTTLRGFMKGLFLFFFTRRFVTISAYNDNALRVITNNYVDRINQGRIKKYKDEDINRVIVELKKDFEDVNSKFWSGNTSKSVMRARYYQRAVCYLNAIVKGRRDDDIIQGITVPYRNENNTIKSGFKGAFEGLFGGIIGFALIMFILWATLALIVFIVELFD